MPVQIIVHHKMVKWFRRRRPLQNPAADFVLKKINRRHREQKDVVQIRRDRRRHFVRSTNPRESDREQRLQRVKRRRSEEHTSELQSRENLVCRLLLEKKKKKKKNMHIKKKKKKTNKKKENKKKN